MIATLHDNEFRTGCEQDEQRTPVENVRLGIPDAAWSREELYGRADWEISKLKERKSFAPIYWWLGKVLLLVRDEFEQRGEWTAWRVKHKIDRTRAQRSQLFARAFDSPGELEGLPIKKADRLARQRLGLLEPPTEEEQRIHRRLLLLTKKTLPDSLRDLGRVSDPTSLLPLVAELGEQVELFVAAVRSKAPPSVTD